MKFLSILIVFISSLLACVRSFVCLFLVLYVVCWHLDFGFVYIFECVCVCDHTILSIMCVYTYIFR